jgi:hypothetical protein
LLVDEHASPSTRPGRLPQLVFSYWPFLLDLSKHFLVQTHGVLAHTQPI